MRLSFYVSEKPCLVPETILHANTSKTGVVLFGDQVTVECHDGYGVNGSTVKTQTIKCKADQKFEDTVSCQGGFTPWS